MDSQTTNWLQHQTTLRVPSCHHSKSRVYIEWQAQNPLLIHVLTTSFTMRSPSKDSFMSSLETKSSLSTGSICHQMAQARMQSRDTPTCSEVRPTRRSTRKSCTMSQCKRGLTKSSIKALQGKERRKVMSLPPCSQTNRDRPVPSDRIVHHTPTKPLNHHWGVIKLSLS